MTRALIRRWRSTRCSMAGPHGRIARDAAGHEIWRQDALGFTPFSGQPNKGLTEKLGAAASPMRSDGEDNCFGALRQSRDLPLVRSSTTLGSTGRAAQCDKGYDRFARATPPMPTQALPVCNTCTVYFRGGGFVTWKLCGFHVADPILQFGCSAIGARPSGTLLK